MPKTRAKVGDYAAECDVCHFRFYASELRERWDGLMVCKQDFELRHPMDFYNPDLTERPPEWIRPPQADVFVDTSGWEDTSTEDPDPTGHNNGDL